MARDNRDDLGLHVWLERVTQVRDVQLILVGAFGGPHEQIPAGLIDAAADDPRRVIGPRVDLHVGRLRRAEPVVVHRSIHQGGLNLFAFGRLRKA